MKDDSLTRHDAYWTEGEARDSRWLITCDHATNRVPGWVGGGDLGIAPEDMARHIAYDVGAAGVSRRLGALIGAPVFLQLIWRQRRGR